MHWYIDNTRRAGAFNLSSRKHHSLTRGKLIFKTFIAVWLSFFLPLLHTPTLPLQSCGKWSSPADAFAFGKLKQLSAQHKSSLQTLDVWYVYYHSRCFCFAFVAVASASNMSSNLQAVTDTDTMLPVGCPQVLVVVVAFCFWCAHLAFVVILFFRDMLSCCPLVVKLCIQ